MTEKQRTKLIDALCEFCVRMTKDNATPEELEALMKIADILLSLPITRLDDDQTVV